MATFQDLINVGYCSESGIGGTGLGYCPFDIKRLKAIWRHPLNFKYPDAFDFTKANIQVLVQEGKIIPLYKTKNTTWNTPENGVQTFEGGDKVVTDRFPYEFSTNFTNGKQYHTVLAQLSNAGFHSFTLIDEDDNIILIKEEDGTLRAINCEFFNVGAYMPQGNDSAMVKVDIQLNDRKAIDYKLSFLKSESYDFAPEEITGVVDLQLKLTAPVSTVNALKFTATQVKDGHSAIQMGLLTGDIKVQEAGVTVPGALAVVNNEYVFTRTTGLFTLAAVVTVETYDTVVASSIINVNDVMIRAAKATTIVV